MELIDKSDALRAKIITMVCTFVISMVVGLLPMLLSMKFDWFTKAQGPDMRSNNKVVIAMLAFGGGVLFSTSIMHLLPEVDENIEQLIETGEISEMPFYLGGLIVCSGFFMMYLIEEVVHLYINKRHRNSEVTLGRALSFRKTSIEGAEIQKTLEEANKGHSHFAAVDGGDGIMGAFRGLLIVLALSIHELFEGLAVGLESSAANVWYMFAAVSAHKYLMAFCIGVELLAAGTKRGLSILYIFVFSFGSALGIGIGALLVGGSSAADAGLASVVLQGIACGTLVYVVFFEVWKRDSDNGLVQFVWALIGFVVMLALAVTVEIIVER